MTEGEDREIPSILSKAFEVLRAFNSRDRVMTLSEIAAASGLPKSTTHRLIGRLVELDAVERHNDSYKLSLGLVGLASRTPASELRDVALPFLTELHRNTAQTVHLCVLRQFDVIYLEKLTKPGCPSELYGVGSRLPANCTAVGKVLLAALDETSLHQVLPSTLKRLTPKSITDREQLTDQLAQIARDGLAVEVGESRPGLRCVAAPIVVRGAAVASVSLAHRAEERLPEPALRALRATALRIAREVRATVPAVD